MILPVHDSVRAHVARLLTTIYALDETPEKWKNFIAVNADYFQKA